MSYSNQDYTEHQFHGFIPGCEWCEHERRPRAKKFGIEALGERLRKAANSMDKVQKFVKVVEDAEKNNPNGLPF